MKHWLSALVVSSLSFTVLAQSSYDSIEAEINSAQGAPTPAVPPPEIMTPPKKSQLELDFDRKPKAPPALPRKNQRAQVDPSEVEAASVSAPARKSRGSSVDEEMRMQDRILKRKETSDPEVSADRDLDRFPKSEPVFVKPPGPKQGGSVRVEHPRAAEGLIRINKDGSYQYKTQVLEKSQSGSLRAGMMTPPKITTNREDVDYESMYGSENIFALEGDYTWQPFRKYGALGLKLGGGFSTVSAKGYFKERDAERGERSEESYNLYIVPVSAFLEYRFEYFRRQWVVPFISGGGTYYGLMEMRDDGKTPAFSGAPAVGGGGGVLLSISRLDPAGAFTLSQEYGIADMWLVVEGRVMKGLSEDIDFSNETISAGIAVDF